MTSYDRSEVVTTRVEYRLRAPVPIGEVYKAVAAALAEKGIRPEDPLPSDDVLMVQPWDDAIVIYFDKEVRRG